MASPFSIFRKNQKLMFAVLGVMVMFAFVFIPIIMEGMGSRTVSNPVVVKTSKYGSLKEYDVASRLKERQQVLGVLTDVMQLAGASPTLARQILEARIGPATETSVINAWLLARYAEQMGMVISDKTIIDFLQAMTQNVVKADQFQAAFKRSGLSEFRFLNAMRDELAALQIDNLFQISLRGITPAQRWDYFTRVKQLATIEAAPVPAVNYLAKIEDPGDEKLKAFFEEHKEQYPQPGSPEPGFREPKKIAIQYFKADYDKFIAANVATDEEIKQQYEKNKDIYDQLEKKLAGDKEEKTSTKDTKDTKGSKEVKEAKEAKETKQQEATEKETPKDPKDVEEKKTPQESKEVEGTKPAEKPAESKPGLSETTKNRIRREIAYEKIQKVFQNLRRPMDEYRRQWNEYKVQEIHARSKKEGKGGETTLPPPPTRPDFEKLAKQHGLSAGRTELLSQWQVQGMEIGNSFVGGRDPVWHYAFLTTAPFRPEESLDLNGRYLYWKTDETKERVPEFKDQGMREAVLRAWKMAHGARDLALKEAESLAAEAAKTKISLKQALADRPALRVESPPPFSWITFGNVPLGSAPNAGRISSVAGVDMAGEDFMRAVFRLEPGQTGAAMNAPKTVAYVIRLVEYAPSRDVLWKQFEVDDFSTYAPASEGDRQQIARAWLSEIKTEAGFQLAPGRTLDRATDSGPRGEEE